LRIYGLNIPVQWTRDRPLLCGGEGMSHNKWKKDMHLTVYYAGPRICRYSLKRRKERERERERDEEEEDM